MQRILLVLCCLLIMVTAISCAKKQQVIEPPSEPTVTLPLPSEIPPAPTELPPQAPTPAPLPPSPSMKPRPPAAGDTAAVKLVDRGVRMMNAGNIEEAEQLFEQALRVSPTNGKPYYYLGVISLKQKYYERALGFLSQAEVYLHPESFWMSQVLLQEGLALKGLNRRGEARTKFQEAVRRDPSNKWAQTELSSIR